MAMKQGELVPQIFEHEQFGKIRVIGDSENPRFCLSDACKMLGLTVKGVVQRLDKEVISNYPLETAGGVQQMYFVNEDGLYDCVLESRKPEAKRFRKWITAEVIPSIRKHGFYATPAKIEEIVRNPEVFIEHLITAYQRVKTERDELQLQIAELKPKASYCEKILQSDEALPVTVIAKDYGMGAAEFNALLHKLKIQFKTGRTWVLYQLYAGLGYTKSVTRTFANEISATVTYWTQKGRMFLYSMLKKSGILPLIEREDPQLTLM